MLLLLVVLRLLHLFVNISLPFAIFAAGGVDNVASVDAAAFGGVDTVVSFTVVVAGGVDTVVSFTVVDAGGVDTVASVCWCGCFY